MRIPSGVTDQVIYFVAVDSADFTTRETGLSTFTVYRSRNGAAAAAMTTPTVTEVDATNMPGVYKLLLDEDMTIGSGNDSEEMVFHITQASMAPVSRTIELYRPKITVGNTLDVTTTGAAGIDWGNIENKTTANDLSATDIQLVDTVTTYTGNTPQTADHTAAIADIPTVAEFNARTLVAASYFDPAADTVANVTTVATCTTNSDMVAAAPTANDIADQVWDESISTHTTPGTTGAVLADIETDATAILADTADLQANQGNWLTATGFSTHTALDVWHVAAASVVTASTIGLQLKTNIDAAVSSAGGDDAATIYAHFISGANEDVFKADVSALATQASVDVVDGNVDAILIDTNELQTNQGNWLTATGFATSAALATAQSDLDTITGTDGATLATAQALYAPNKTVPDAAGTPVVLADSSSDAIIADAVWNALTATYGGVGSYGEHVESLSAGGDATEAKQDSIIAAVITNAAGADIAADIIAVKAETALIVADTNELQTDWVDGGRLDNLLDGAASAGDPWTTTLPGAYGAGTAGYIVGTNIDVASSTLATSTALATVDTVVDAVKAETALIVADTNELQTDWVDGGRLDLLLDSAAVATEAGITSVDVLVIGSASLDLVDVGADLYVSKFAGDDINGDGSLLSPFRSYWRAYDEVSTGETIALLRDTTTTAHMITATESAETDIDFSVVACGEGTGKHTFDAGRIITGSNKSPMFPEYLCRMDIFRTTDAVQNDLPVGWVNPIQYPAAYDGTGGYVTGSDSDGDGLTDCCAIGSHGGATRAGIYNARAPRVATGQTIEVTAKLKSDGNANSFDIGFVASVRLNGTGATYYWDGSAWVATAPGVSTAGNTVKLNVDSDGKTFDTTKTTWETYRWEFTIPDESFGTGGTFATHDLVIGFVTRSGGIGEAYVKDIAIPQTTWVEGSTANNWYLPTGFRAHTSGLMVSDDAHEAKIYEAVLGDIDGASFAAVGNGTVLFSLTDPNTWDDEWTLMHRSAVPLFNLVGDAVLTDIKFVNVGTCVWRPSASTADATIIGCEFFACRDCINTDTVYSSSYFTVSNCDFQKIGNYWVWEQHGTYATYGGGSGVNLYNAGTVDSCTFEQCYIDMVFAGLAVSSPGPVTVTNNTSYLCTINSIWLANASTGINVVEFNTVVQCGIHSIIARDQDSGIGSNRIRNNLIQCADYTGFSTGVQVDADALTTVSDYNLVFGTLWPFVWSHTYHASLAAHQSADSQDLNSYDSDPLLSDPAAGDFQPLTGSDAIGNASDSRNIGRVQ